jgi:RNA polymerase sigma-70 factor (ECF subfamily)
MLAMPERSDPILDGDELVRRVRAGDTDSFALIVRRYQGAVWKVAAAMLEDRVATENLVQQTFVNAYQRLAQYQLGRDLGLWLKGITRNLAREELRRRSRETDVLAHYRRYLDAFLAEDGGEEREAAAQRAMASCRGELAPAASRALSLFYDDGCSMDEIARELGRTSAAVRLLVFRARLALRACVERRLGAA